MGPVCLVGKTGLPSANLGGELRQNSHEGFAFPGFFPRSLLKASFQRSCKKKPGLTPRLFCLVGKTGFPPEILKGWPETSKPPLTS
jgi:hypothetical protein